MSKTSYTTRFSYALPDIGGQLLFGWIMWKLNERRYQRFLAKRMAEK